MEFASSRLLARAGAVDSQSKLWDALQTTDTTINPAVAEGINRFSNQGHSTCEASCSFQQGHVAATQTVEGAAHWKDVLL